MIDFEVVPSVATLLNEDRLVSLPSPSQDSDNQLLKKSLTRKRILKAQQKSTGSWSSEEHSRFIKGVRKFGKNWAAVTEYVGSRTKSQITNHATIIVNQETRIPNSVAPDIIKILKGIN